MLNKMKKIAVLSLVMILSLSWSGVVVGGKPSADMLKKVDGALPTEGLVVPKKARQLLIFSGTKGYRHGSIEVGVEAFIRMGKKTGAYAATATEDVNVFTKKNLKQYDGILFMSMTGEVITKPEHKKALMDFVKRGKGVIGIHAATDSHYKWAEFGEMLGGYFDGHPWGSNTPVVIDVEDSGHKLCGCLGGKSFEFKEEIYQFKNFDRKQVRVLLGLNVGKSQKVGGLKRTDGDYPVSWVKRHGKGRVFYCSIGHNHFMFWDKQVLAYYLGGIQYALGDVRVNEKSLPQYDGSKTVKELVNNSVTSVKGFDVLSLEKKLSAARKEIEDKLSLTQERAGEVAAVQSDKDQVGLIKKVAGFKDSKDAKTIAEFKKMADVVRKSSGEIKDRFAERVIAAMGKSSDAGLVWFAGSLKGNVSEKHVASLVALMELNGKPSAFAARVLGGIESGKSTDALRGALGYAKNWFLASCIEVLGDRKDQASYGRFVELLDDQYELVRIKSFKAICLLNREESGGVIVDHLKHKTNDSSTREKTSYGYSALSYAQNALKEKRLVMGKAIIEEVFALDLDTRVDLRALNLYASVITNKDADIAMTFLKSSDKKVQEAAVKCVGRLSDDESFKAVTHMLSRFSSSVKPIAIAALIERSKGKRLGRHEAYAGKEIAKFVNYSNQKVRGMAMRGVSQLGDPSTMLIVAKTGAVRGGVDESAAISALASYRGKWYRQTLIDSVSDHSLSAGARLIMLKASEKRGLSAKDFYSELRDAAASKDKKLSGFAKKMLGKYKPKDAGGELVPRH